MPYNVAIRNEQGQPIAGTVYFFNEAGEEIGQAGISAGGSTLSNEEVESASHYKVASPGYYTYGSAGLYETNNFTLVKKTPPIMPLMLGGVMVFIAIKLLKRRA